MSRPLQVDDEDDLPATSGERRAGQWLQTLVLGTGAWVVAMSALAAVLAGAGWWFPWLVNPLALVVAVASGWWVRRVPARSLPLWTAALLASVSLGAAMWTATTHSEQVLPRRDSGSYLQTAISMAGTHGRSIPVNAADLGGPEVLALPGVTLSSPAFYQVGPPENPSVQPQFVMGPGAIWSLGVWLGGPTGAMLLPSLVSAIGILGVGLLTARLGALRWSPLAAGGVALSFPVLHTARSTYSEPLAMVTLGAGLLALTVAAREGRRDEVGRAAMLAGVLIGGTAFVRVDALRETILLLPVLGFAVAQGRRWPRTTLTGAVASTALALLAALWLSDQYLRTIAGSLLPLLALGVLLALMTAGLVRWQRRGGSLPPRVRHSLPDALGLAVVLVGLLLASRPVWQTVRQDPGDPGSRVVAGLQQRQGLPIDGGRTYAEQTVAWLSWWVGAPALLIALGVLALAVRGAARRWIAGQLLPPWMGPLVIAAGSTVLTLWRPGITPDHPWAERRLLIALPFVTVLCTFGAACAVRNLARRAPVAGAVMVALPLVAATLVPTAVATWPHRAERVELGELAAVEGVCRRLGPKDVVLAVDSRAANEWPQVVRGMCGRPALSTTAPLREDRDALASAVTSISRALEPRGGRLVLLAADSPAVLDSLGVTPTRVLDTTVLEDARLLERRPERLVTLPLQVWVGTGLPGEGPTRDG